MMSATPQFQYVDLILPGCGQCATSAALLAQSPDFKTKILGDRQAVHFAFPAASLSRHH
jgi:hypothetical protein